MKQTRHKNLQRQINNLIPLIELYLPLVAKIKQTQGKLNFLPEELKSLKEQAESFKLESRAIATSDSELEIEKAEFKIDSLVDDLEKTLVHLTTLDCDIKNLLVLKERIEAIQEERIEGITPERIYKLLEKQQPLSQFSQDPTLIRKQNTSLKQPSWKQKIFNYSSNIGNKTIATGLIVISLSCGWIAGFYSSGDALSSGDGINTESSK